MWLTISTIIYLNWCFTWCSQKIFLEFIFRDHYFKNEVAVRWLAYWTCSTSASLNYYYCSCRQCVYLFSFLNVLYHSVACSINCHFRILNFFLILPQILDIKLHLKYFTKTKIINGILFYLFQVHELMIRSLGEHFDLNPDKI